MQYTKIVKLASGNVQLQNASDSPVKTLQPAANLELLPDDAGVRIKQWQGENTDILISQVAFTRLDPAADVAFSGTAQDLLTLLSESFFFELEASAFPDYPIGSYQSFTSGYSFTTAFLTANSLYGMIINIEKEVEVESLSIETTSTVAGAAVAGIYQYTDDGTPNGTWLLRGQTDSASPYNLGVASVQTVLLTAPVTLESGIYAFAILGNSAPIVQSQQLSNSITFGGHLISQLNTYKNTIVLSLAYTASLPLSISPTISQRGNAPIIAAKVI
jgi:hypothetical protein